MDVVLHPLLILHQALGYLLAFVIGPGTLLTWSRRVSHRKWGQAFFITMLALYVTGTPRTFLLQAPLSWGFARNLTFNFFGILLLICGYRAIRVWLRPTDNMTGLDRGLTGTLMVLGVSMVAIGMADLPMLIFGIVAIGLSALDVRDARSWSHRPTHLRRHVRYVFGSYYYVLTVLSIVHLTVSHDRKWLWPTFWALAILLVVGVVSRMRLPSGRSALPWSVRAALTANFALCLVVLFQGGQSVADMVLARSMPLEKKLERQWQQYDVAQRVFRERIEQGVPIYRSQWEALLDPGWRFHLSQADLDLLRNSQRERIARQAQIACASSPIDLNEVRRCGRVREFCVALPKGGMLHVHPYGTLQRPTVQKLLHLVNPPVSREEMRSIRGLPDKQLEFLERYASTTRFLDLGDADRQRLIDLYFLGNDTSFARFDAVFKLVAHLRSHSSDDLQETIFSDFFERARREKIRYVEFTYGFPLTGDSLREIERRAERAKQEFGLSMRVNYAFHRAASPARMLDDLDQLLRLLDEHPTSPVVGIDMLGKEPGFPAFECGQFVYGRAAARRPNLHRTIHAAGLGEIRNLRDAMLMGAERIGHGTRWLESPVSLEFAARHRVPVEVNLVSNVRLGYASDFHTHPVVPLLRLGLRVSLSTDDEGILETSLSNEFAMLIGQTDISYEEVKQLLYNSIDTSFCSPREREALQADLNQDLLEFEREWKQRSVRPFTRIAEHMLFTNPLGVGPLVFF